MGERYWIVWNSRKSEGVVFDNEADARLTAKGYDAMQKALKRGLSVPALGEEFAEWQDEPMTVEEVRPAVHAETQARPHPHPIALPVLWLAVAAWATVFAALLAGILGAFG